MKLSKLKIQTEARERLTRCEANYGLTTGGGGAAAEPEPFGRTQWL